MLDPTDPDDADTLDGEFEEEPEEEPEAEPALLVRVAEASVPLTELAPLPVPTAPVPIGATPTSVAEVTTVARVVLVLVMLGIADGPVVR